MLGARDQLVGLAHVGLMVLAVMEAQGLSRAVRFQCVLRVGQGGELKGHAVSLFLSLSVRSEQNPTPCGAGSSVAMHYRQLASRTQSSKAQAGSAPLISRTAPRWPRQQTGAGRQEESREGEEDVMTGKT